jgi:hypothetical protein
MQRARWGILAGLLAALPATSAQADDNATRDAQARFVEGIARVKKGDFEAARLSFAQAYTVLHKPDILWNLALAEEKSGHVVEALGHFRELGKDGSASEDRTKAKKHVEALMAQTGHIEVVAPSGTKVNVDGAEAGVAPLGDAVDVLPGKHHVVAGEKATDADVTAGEVAHVSFLVTEAPALPVVPAVPAATSEPVPPPPPREARVQGGETSDSTGRAITVIAIGTLAVTGGVLGVAFGLGSQNNANTAAQLRGNDPSACTTSSESRCAQLKDAVDAENRDHTLSTVSYVTGAALVAGAVATWWMWPRHAQAPAAASVVPTLGPTGCGVGLAGLF